MQVLIRSASKLRACAPAADCRLRERGGRWSARPERKRRLRQGLAARVGWRRLFGACYPPRVASGLCPRGLLRAALLLGAVGWLVRGGGASQPAALPVVAAAPAVSLGIGGSAANSATWRPSADERFLAGLRARGLYELAEAYCRQQLARGELDDRRRAELTIELLRALAESAASTPAIHRDALWQQAQQAVDQFVRTQPANPRLALVRLQGALVELTRGELARQEAWLVAQNEALLEEARTHLRQAIKLLRSLDEQVRRQWSEQNLAGPPAPGRLSAEQLQSISNHIHYELARALRNQAQSYAPDSPDAANALTQAIQLLEPLAGLSAAEPLSWKARLDLVICHRLLGDRATAARLLAELSAAGPPAEVELRARAERIELALPDNLPQALAALSDGRQLAGRSSPELDYAHLSVYLAAWQAAVRDGRTDEAARWQAEAERLVQLIESQHGFYWQLRAEMLLAGTVRHAPAEGNLSMLIRAAEAAYRSGRPEEALAAYDRARQTAARQGQAAEAFRLGFVAATIEHKRNNHAEALRRYRELSLAFPREPQAPEAHLLAIFHAGQLAKPAQTGGPAAAALDTYNDLLAEHLETWPQAPSADEVRWRLGRLQELAAQWDRAIELYRQISISGPRGIEVVQALERCTAAWLAERRGRGESCQAVAAQAAEWFEALIRAPGQPWPQQFTAVDRAAALAAARMWLNSAQPGSARAEAVLRAALAGSAGAPQSFLCDAQALLVFSLAASGRTDEAGRVLEQLSAAAPEQLVELVADLRQLAAQAPPETARALAELRLQAAALLEPAGAHLPAGQQRLLEFARAQALADAGRADEALGAFARLAQRYPGDAEIQEAYARLLSGRADRGSLEKALECWRGLEGHLPEASPEWFRAKYAIAELHFRLGAPEQAARIVRLLELLHPELGGPELRSQFKDLLRRCAGPGR